MIKKNLKKFISILIISFFSISSAKATDECFENTSRAIFKFNMAFDDIILEPLANGYNKLPNPIKAILSISYRFVSIQLTRLAITWFLFVSFYSNQNV